MTKNDLSNLYMDNVIPACYTISFIIIAILLISSYRQYQIDNATTVRPIDTTRVEEGLPTDMTLTPEDFLADPELAEIFGITDPNTNLDINLESNEHFEEVQNQIEIATNFNDNFMTSLELYNEDYLEYLYDEYLITFFNYIINYDLFMLPYDIVVAFISYFT
jgi:hypothetical protein